MKMRKKAALAAVIFSAALNTACQVYGPPQENWEPEKNNTETVSSDGTERSESETETDASDETKGDERQ